MPKTGGTFVTTVLERLYKERGLPFVNINKHGACDLIPTEYEGLPIIATIRNPFDRYVSQYCFAWWKHYPDAYCGAKEMRRMFPHYPDLTFNEFVELAHVKFRTWHNPKETLGWHTEQFVRFFFKNAKQRFSEIDMTYLANRDFKGDLFPVRFLRVENLNRELYTFLESVGWLPERLRFVLEAPKIFPPEGGREPADNWRSYYSPELRLKILHRECLLFMLFPEYAAENEPW